MKKSKIKNTKLTSLLRDELRSLNKKFEKRRTVADVMKVIKKEIKAADRTIAVMVPGLGKRKIHLYQEN